MDMDRYGRSGICLFLRAEKQKHPGLYAQGENIFRGTTCFQRLYLCTLSVLNILCSCNVELTLKPTEYTIIKDTVGFTARGLLLQSVHESFQRPLSLWESRDCVLLPVVAFRMIV